MAVTSEGRGPGSNNATINFHFSWGGLMMFGSYNKFHNKINIDAAVVSSLDFITSLIASCVIFSVLGFLSHEIDVPVEHVAKGGQVWTIKVGKWYSCNS